MLSGGIHQGMEVQVLREDGTAFTEHRIVNMPARPGHPMTTTCWLEVEQDTTFIIMIKLHPIVLNAYHPGAWGTTTSIDGKVINDSVESSVQSSSRTFKVSTMTYETFAGHLTGELKFTKLKTINCTFGRAKKPYDQEGPSIQVDFEAGTVGARNSNLSHPTYSADSPNGISAHERDAKKTGTAVSAANSRPAAKMETWQWHPLDKQNPYHRFIFKYRTRPVLEILKVIQSDDYADSTLPTANLKRKRSNSQDRDTDARVPREMLQVMMDMRRDMNVLRQTVTRLENAARHTEVINLLDSDSD